MNISEVKVKLVSDRNEKLRAFCSVTIDHDFLIRDVKVIQGTKGCFVAMPSRKLMDRCPSCGGKNHLRAAHCNECGKPLQPNRVPHDETGHAKWHADIAHPINAACRERFQQRVLEAFVKEVEKAKRPGYVPTAADEVLAVGAEMDADDARVPGPAARLERAAPPPPLQPPKNAVVPVPPPSVPQEDSFSGGIL